MTILKIEERVDVRAVHYLVDNFQELIFPFINGQTEEDKIGQETIVNKYKRKIKNGKVKVTYKKKGRLGRFFAEGGLSIGSINRVFRHTVCRDIYHDIDISNCHPVLLSQYCHDNGLSCPVLNEFVADRNKFTLDVLQELNDGGGEAMEKGEVKRRLISYIYGKEKPIITSGKAEQFYLEMERIRNTAMKLEPKYVRCVKAKSNIDTLRGDYNIEGRVMSLVLNDMECEVLMSMKKYMDINNHTVGVLCFDGLCVEKDSIPAGKVDSILRECEKFVLDDVGKKITLVLKEMDEGVEIPEDFNVSNYSLVKEKFETNNFKCRTPPIFYNTERGRLQMLTKSDFITLHEDIFYKDSDGNEKSFIKTWLYDPNKRQYTGVEWVPPPLKATEGCYNSWEGFEVEKVAPCEEDEAPGLKVILDHILLLSDGDVECYNYIIKWLAHLFQYPSEKNNTALCFRSKQGIGKDMFHAFLSSLIGSEMTGNTVHAKRDIFGDFNSYLSRKILITLNEFSGSVGFKYDNPLKELITGETVKIRRMRTSPVVEGSFLRLMFFTNNDFPVRITRDDRRFFVVDINQPIPGKEYFDSLHKVFSNKRSQRGFYEFLLRQDIDGFDWTKDKPETAFLEDLKAVAVDKELSFLKDLIREKCSDGVKKLNVTAKEVLGLFMSYCTSMGVSYSTNPVKLGIKIKKYGIAGIVKKRNKKGVFYCFDIDKCVESLIQLGHLEDDFMSLDDGNEPLGYGGSSKTVVGGVSVEAGSKCMSPDHPDDDLDLDKEGGEED